MEDDDSWTAAGDTNLVHRRLIERGAYGELTDRDQIREFARKIIRPFGTFSRQDIENEMRAIDHLQGAEDEGGGGKKTIIDILGHGRFGGPFSFHYIDMELCDINLHDYIYNNRRVVTDMPSFRRNSAAFVRDNVSVVTKLLNVWTIMQQIASGLAFIHFHSQVHRDMKPRNVLYSCSRDCWKIADFGCTAEATSAHARTTVLSRGTTSYRAPELLEEPGNFTNKVDIWAMGCILYELVMAKRAFHDDWQVHTFRLNQSEFEISGSLFDASMAGFISGVVNWLLQRDWRNRPNAITARSHFDKSIEQATTRPALKGDDPYKVRNHDSDLLSTLKMNLITFPCIERRIDLADEYMKEGKIDLEIKVRKDIVRLHNVGIIELQTAYDRQGEVHAAILGWKELIESRLPYPKLFENLFYARLQNAFKVKGIGQAEIEYWKGRVVDGSDDGSEEFYVSESLRIEGGDLALLETWQELVGQYPNRVYFRKVLAGLFRKET